MRLTKKHFVFIAETINDARDDAAVVNGSELSPDLDALTNLMALRLQSTNPAFNPERFRIACGFGEVRTLPQDIRLTS